MGTLKLELLECVTQAGAWERGETYNRHISDSENLDIVNTYEYDKQGRIVAEYQKTGSQNTKQISEYTYNELGQLLTKRLVDNSNEDEQTLTYSYHERGWLKSVNDPDNTPIGDDFLEQFFGYELCYDDASNCGGSGNLHNGNITAIKWGKPSFIYPGETNTKTYDYSYDRLNQLTSADFIGGENTSSFETSYSYDLNGNMLSLERTQNAYSLDDLTYSYSGIGNQITSINDENPDNFGAGFSDKAETTDEYGYDANGNMVRDDNKGILSISYNYMNLPEVIVLDDGNNGEHKIVYTYDASGTKLSQKTYPSGSAGVVTEYSVGFVYENGTLSYFPFSEGSVRKVSSDWRYEFNLKDHLGNVRLTFYYDDNNEGHIIQSDDYYPYGMKMAEYSYVATGSAENKYTYNGKELEDDLGLNFYYFKARYYDASVGRWWNIDPLGQFHSAYSTNYNNPIVFKDDNGEYAHLVIGGVIGLGAGIRSVYKEKGFKNWDWKDVGRVVVSTGTGVAIAAVPSYASYLSTTIIGGSRAGVIAVGGDILDQALEKDGFTNIDGWEATKTGIATFVTFGVAQPVSRYIRNRADNRYWGLVSKTNPRYTNWKETTPWWARSIRNHEGIAGEFGNVSSDILKTLFENTWNWFKNFGGSIPEGEVFIEQGWGKYIDNDTIID